MSKFGAVSSTVGKQVAVAAGQKAATAVLSALGVASAATIVGLVATPVLILIGKIFHGADPRQVPASQVEQSFEAASNNLCYVGQAGMISRDEALAGMRLFLQKGDQFYAEQGKALGAAGEKGKANMHKVIEAEISAASRAIQPTRTRALDLAAASALYEKPGKAGWYKESLEAAARLADAYLAELPKAPAEKVASAVSKTASLLAGNVSESLPVPVWAVAGGVLLLAVLWGVAE